MDTHTRRLAAACRRRWRQLRGALAPFAPAQEALFDARIDRDIERLLPVLGPVLGLFVLLFGAWDAWIDPVHAGTTLRLRIVLVLLGAPAYLRGRLHASASLRCAVVYATHAGAMTVSAALLRELGRPRHAPVEPHPGDAGHARLDPAGAHRIALLDQHLGHAARHPRRHVDFRRFDAAVAADESGTGFVGSRAAPGVHGPGRDDEDGAACDDVPVACFLHAGCPLRDGGASRPGHTSPASLAPRAVPCSLH